MLNQTWKEWEWVNGYLFINILFYISYISVAQAPSKLRIEFDLDRSRSISEPAQWES